MRSAIVFVAAALVFAGCASPPTESSNEDPELEEQKVRGGVDTGGGGRIENTGPSVPTFSGSISSADNSGSSVQILTAVVNDPNTVKDITSLTLTVKGVITDSITHSVTVQEQTAADEPASYGADGFKVWGGLARDGNLDIRIRYVIPVGTPAGDAQFSLSATDLTGASGTSAPVRLTISVFSEITIDSTPVAADGTAQVGAAWGKWTAQPGATSVASENYIRLENTGQDATATIVIDYTETTFAGVSDSSYTIPIDGNIQFAWWEGNGRSVPSQGTYTFSPSSDGSVAVTFSGLGQVIYVTYQLASLPSVLPQIDYSATFTATEV